MIIIWHYRDLRLEDHPALSYAAKRALPLIPIYIHDTKAEGLWPSGAASNFWLYESLKSLKARYQKKGSDLLIYRGDSKKIFTDLHKKYDLKEVCWITRYQPSIKERDDEMLLWFKKSGIKTSLFTGNYLADPEEIKTSSKTPYLVFTPFSRALKSVSDWGKPLEIPKLPKISAARSDSLDSLDLLPEHKWYKKLKTLWTPGRVGAEKKLSEFNGQHLTQYETKRDFLSEYGTSQLSPHLAFGEISPREIWHKYCDQKNAEPFLRQLLWREFANSFLHYFPNSTNLSWKEEFEKYPWSNDPKKFSLWKKGQTGYPIVDAAMKQLWQTGWMHNRARMIVGSFLVKDLHIHWTQGASWFWDTLLDADLANNTLGWQWISGSGPDAVPYFRIFNPILQGKKFDPEGHYVRKYLPELRQLPTRFIHNPWSAPSSVLAQANVTLGKNYPEPIVDHDEARKKALLGYKKIKR